MSKAAALFASQQKSIYFHRKSQTLRMDWDVPADLCIAGSRAGIPEVQNLLPLPASFQQLKIPANPAVTNSRPPNIPHPMMLGRFHSPQIFLLNQRLL